jgi:hypothetical protein
LIRPTLARLAGTFAVARLPPAAPIPAWAAGPLTSVTRTADELSIVCADAAVPVDVRAERDFAAVRVTGTVDFAVVGLLASLTRALADAGVSVFALSTFDTDYLLVRTRDWPRARAALASVAVLVDERQ